MDWVEGIVAVVVGAVICCLLFLGYALIVNWRAQDLERARFCARTEFSSVPAICEQKGKR